MILAVFSRLLKLVFTSIICSLFIYLGNFLTISDKGILFLSFVTFGVAISIDSYCFSFDFYRIWDYFVGQLLPLVIYIVMGFLTCLAFNPIVFNRIFLPLRFAGCFGMRTIESIAVMGIAFIAIVAVFRFFGARSGYFLHSKYVISEDEE